MAEHEFEETQFRDFVAAHGAGNPTPEGVEYGERLMREGDDVATAAFEVVALGMTDDLEVRE